MSHVVIILLFLLQNINASIALYASNTLTKCELYTKQLYIDENITVLNGENKKISISDFRDNVLLIVFWATWDSGYIDTIKKLDVLQKDFIKLPFKILPISEDFSDIKNILSFYTRYEIKHIPILQDQHNQLLKSLTESGLPVSFLVDGEGKVIAKFLGLVNWSDNNIRQQIINYIPGDHALPRNSFKEPGIHYNPNMLHEESKMKTQ